MARKSRGTWIKLYHEFTESEKFGDYVCAVCQGKKGKAARRAAEDAAFANAVRLYLTLGRSDGGSIDCRRPGGLRMLARGLELDEEEAERVLGQMAEFGIIDTDAWQAFRTVKTTNSMEQGEMRQSFKERSANASGSKGKGK